MKIRIIAITKDPDLKSAEKTLENWKENCKRINKY